MRQSKEEASRPLPYYFTMPLVDIPDAGAPTQFNGAQCVYFSPPLPFDLDITGFNCAAGREQLFLRITDAGTNTVWNVEPSPELSLAGNAAAGGGNVSVLILPTPYRLSAGNQLMIETLNRSGALLVRSALTLVGRRIVKRHFNEPGA
jgi:hypothetical protein